jgi:hypothetical protein
MRVTFAAVAALALGGVLSAQSGGGSALVAGSGSSGVLTATVIYAAHVHQAGDGASALDVLVLLRGASGWYARTPRGGSVLSGASTGANNGQPVATYWASGGGFTVTFATDSQLPTIHLKIESSKAGVIFDAAVEPERTNVVLVDGAGGEDEPKIRALWIEPRLQGDGSAAVLAIRKSSGLMNFVQCDTSLPDETPDAQGPLGRSLRNAIARTCDDIRARR